MKFSGKVGNGPMNKSLNFGGDPDHRSGTDPDPYRDTGKTCLGGGMHCPCDSSLFIYLFIMAALLHRATIRNHRTKI